ncbi:hypothetical protein VTN96DRAFT_5560 [Rasamsonia emersonii]
MSDPKDKDVPPTPAEGESNPPVSTTGLSNPGVPTTGVSPIDKPLPPPPPTENGPEPTAPQESATPASPKSAKRAAVVTNGTAQRTKKRIIWRGKACIISVPVEDKRGSEEAGYRLLTQADIEQRLQKWIDEGYDIRGFDVYAPEEDAVPADSGALSRLPYPDPAECQQEWKERKYAISFPNQAEWDAYVNFLKEEKLRALGVSMGDDDPPSTMSPGPMAALNAAALAGYPGLIASPPVPTSSAASNPLLGVHPFSPHFNQSTNPSTNAGSLASPAPQFGGQHPFFGVDSNMVAGLSYPFQPTPPVAGTLTPQSLFNARQAGVVSAGPGNLPNLNSLLSPVSPLNQEDSNTFHQGVNDMLAPRRDSVRGQDSSQQNRKSRATTMVSEAQAEPEHYQTSNVEIAQPTPRGHSHNLSETLQKGLDRYSQADYHLEESIQRQLEENDREPTSSLMKSRWAVPENEVQSSQFPKKDSFSQGHHRLFGEQRQAQADQDGDEIDTNPSLEGTPRDQEQDLSHHPWHSAKPSTGSFVGGHHKSRTSMSTLNVEAKEFDPTTSLSSNTFTFHGSSFQPGSFDSPSTIFSPSSTVFKPGGFNATAPAFTPFGSQATSFSPSGFTFSTSSFNVDAPEFNPGQSVTTNGKSDAPDHLKSRIFGDIDFSQITKPSKKSKAIPIVRPDDAERERNKQKDEEVDNSASGPQPRQKRARHGAEDGDKDAEIAPSALPLGEAAQPQASAAPSQSHKQADGKENAAPDDSAAADASADVKPAVADIKPAPPKEVAATEKTVSESVEVKKVEKVDKVEQIEQPVAAAVSEAGSKEQPSPQDTAGKEDVSKEEPEDQVQQAKDEPAAPAPAPSPAPAPEPEPAAEPAPEPPKTEPKKTKGFSFRPSIAEFVPAAFSAFRKKEQPAKPKEEPEKPKEEPQKPKEEPEKPKPTGLMASRYAVPSPPVETNHVEPSELAQVPEEPAPKADSAPTQDTARRQVDPDSPDEQELNAVMEQLNGDDPDIGVERVSTPVRPQEPVETPGAPSTGAPIPPQLRSDAPSPSPRRGLQELLHTVPKLGTEFDVQSQVAVSQRGLASGAQSPVRQLISNDNHISDWDDVIESGEDEKLVQRSKFFDRHINELVGNVLEERLGPLEETLNVIQHSVASLSSRSASRRPLRSASAEVEESDADADDEDDEEVRRPISPFSKKDRKLEKLKNAVVEALVAHQKESQPPAPAIDLAPIQESIAELKALTKPSPDQDSGIKNLIQETIATQLKNTMLRRLTDAEEIGAESLKLQVDGLKSMLRIADERAEAEYKARRDAQDALAEAQKLLKIAEEDAARHRQAAQDAEESLRQLREEKIPHFEKIQNRSDALEKQQKALELTLSELSQKNIALEGTLDEYRESQENWKRQVAEVQNENRELRANVNHLKTRIEDSMRARQSLRGKFDRLQDDMVSATRDIAREQAAWRKKEEEMNAKYDALRAAYDREVKLREKLEMDIAELEQQEREAAKLKFIFGQSQQENARLEELVATLRQESHEYQSKAARFEREFNEARESSRIEVQRTRTAMEADVEAANNQVNYVRAELEAQISRLESQLENVRLEADTMKERYELLLEEARDAKANAVAELTAAKDNALEEQRKRHESVLNDLRERHARALHNASEDRQRTESYLTDKLNLANEKIEHLQDKVTHLEEKLEIAKSAARAAAQAAQAKGAAAAAAAAAASSAPMDHHTTSPSMSFRKDSLVPEKISPQALRESILVLQDQLQQRETRIEELEQQLSEVDHDAPNKLKEKDTEINWLRELLEVRVGDLQDLIDTLSKPSFDQQAVRDAAIRLKANLQMEQQEKERAMAGGRTFPSLASLAASPRSLPLAAAAAWGSWRKGRESFTSEVSPSGYQQTPSKSTNGGGFLSGLLTPPSSNVRQTPKNGSAPVSRMGARRTTADSRGLGQTRPRQAEKLPAHEEPPEPPTTPPLLRRSSYDHDAEPNSYDNSMLMEDGDSVVGESPKGTREGLVAVQN